MAFWELYRHVERLRIKQSCHKMTQTTSNLGLCYGEVYPVCPVCLTIAFLEYKQASQPPMTTPGAPTSHFCADMKPQVEKSALALEYGFLHITKFALRFRTLKLMSQSSSGKAMIL